MSVPDGSNYERELEEKLWSKGWATFRVAGSGTVGHESADIIAAKDDVVIVFEVKSSSTDSFPIDVSDDSQQLLEIGNRANVETKIAVRVKHDTMWKVADPDTVKLEQGDLSLLLALIAGDMEGGL